MGFVLDTSSNVNHKKRYLYVCWLYVFLCFGYTCGSDWRAYEPFYQGLDSLYISPLELGSLFIFEYLPSYISDYWIVAGLFKCFYLSSFLMIVKKLTQYWLSVSALCMYLSLIFILIDNPFRFMVGITMINYCIYNLLDKKYIICIPLLVLSFLFHNSTIIYLLLLSLFLVVDLVASMKKVYLLLIYVCVLILTFDTDYINQLMGRSIMLLQSSMDIKDYSTSYESQSSEAIFSIGNLIKMLVFCIILAYRETIVCANRYGKYIYVLALAYLLIYRVACVLPTGFRIALPFAVFYATAIIILAKRKAILAKIILVYFCLSFVKGVYGSYSYIPYTNSIPYIITGHKSYSERSEYNIREYEEFTGKPVIIDEE